MIWLKALLSRLITRFSTEQKLISAGRAHTLGRLSFIPQTLVGRDYCQYACLNLAHVPRAKRERALKNQIDLLSTWVDVDYSVAWQNGHAQVWFWGVQEIEHLLNGDDEAAPQRSFYNPTFLSEVLYWAKPSSMGLHLLKANQGYDLQYWDNGLLRGSQWYASAPTQQQLQRFSRSQGLSFGVDALEAREPTLVSVLWDGVNSSTLGHFFERRSQIAVGLAALSLLIVSLQLTAIARWSWEEGRLEKQIREITLSANELIVARNQARAARAEASELRELLAMPDPLASQLIVLRHLPTDLTLSLQTWERNIDQVDMTVAGDIPDTLSLVRAFEQNGMKSVRVEPLIEPNKYRVRLMLNGVPQQPGGQK